MSTSPATAKPPRKHFSMIRGFHLADFFTLGNAACGVGTVLLAMLYMASQSPRHFFVAAALAPAALLFDVFDGRIARWRHEHSALGREAERRGRAAGRLGRRDPRLLRLLRREPAGALQRDGRLTPQQTK